MKIVHVLVNAMSPLPQFGFEVGVRMNRGESVETGRFTWNLPDRLLPIGVHEDCEKDLVTPDGMLRDAYFYHHMPEKLISIRKDTRREYPPTDMYVFLQVRSKNWIPIYSVNNYQKPDAQMRDGCNATYVWQIQDRGRLRLQINGKMWKIENFNGLCEIWRPDDSLLMRERLVQLAVSSPLANGNGSPTYVRLNGGLCPGPVRTQNQGGGSRIVLRRPVWRPAIEDLIALRNRQLESLLTTVADLKALGHQSGSRYEPRILPRIVEWEE